MYHQNHTAVEHPIFSVMDALCTAGNTFVDDWYLLQACQRKFPALSEDAFWAQLAELLHSGSLYREGQRIYFTHVWQMEERASESLARRLSLPALPTVKVGPLLADGTLLFHDQYSAVSLALSNRLSIVLGEAGSGKSTLIRAIIADADCAYALCTPTGKTAQLLATSTEGPAYTVHRALGLSTKGVLSDEAWTSIRLLIVDEAGMLALELLDALLKKAHPDCRIVLVGDCNQMPSIGAGNVLADLCALGVPVSRLHGNHRLAADSLALNTNVTSFAALHSADGLVFDGSFQILSPDQLAEEAVQRYARGESVQVLSPTNNAVSELNCAIFSGLMASAPRGAYRPIAGTKLFEGELVLIGKNDIARGCSNGDVGTLHAETTGDGRLTELSVSLPDGRRPVWRGSSILDGLRKINPAYCMTIHKAQGGECDTLLLDMRQQNVLWNRNLFYTAISRAKKQALLFGSLSVIDRALKTRLPRRRSALASKTRAKMHKSA